MSNRPSPLERALELARSGDCANLLDLKDQLRAEGHPTYQIQGPALLKQLRELIKSSYRPLEPGLDF